MSEKDKSQSKEMAELLAENPEAATYIAGVVQGMKLAKAGAQAQEDGKENEPAYTGFCSFHERGQKRGRPQGRCCCAYYLHKAG